MACPGWNPKAGGVTSVFPRLLSYWQAGGGRGLQQREGRDSSRCLADFPGEAAPQSAPTSSCSRDSCGLPVPALWALASHSPHPAHPAAMDHHLVKPILGNPSVWGSWGGWPPSLPLQAEVPAREWKGQSQLLENPSRPRLWAGQGRGGSLTPRETTLPSPRIFFKPALLTHN